MIGSLLHLSLERVIVLRTDLIQRFRFTLYRTRFRNNIEIDEMVLRDRKQKMLHSSVMNEWVRMFECLLLSYKLPLKKGEARGKKEKLIVAENKTRILCGLKYYVMRPYCRMKDQ